MVPPMPEAARDAKILFVWLGLLTALVVGGEVVRWARPYLDRPPTRSEGRAELAGLMEEQQRLAAELQVEAQKAHWDMEAPAVKAALRQAKELQQRAEQRAQELDRTIPGGLWGDDDKASRPAPAPRVP